MGQGLWWAGGGGVGRWSVASLAFVGSIVSCGLDGAASEFSCRMVSWCRGGAGARAIDGGWWKGPGCEWLCVKCRLLECALGLWVVGEGAELGCDVLWVAFGVWVVEEEGDEVDAVVEGVGGVGELGNDVMLVLVVAIEVGKVGSKVGGDRGSRWVTRVKLEGHGLGADVPALYGGDCIMEEEGEDRQGGVKGGEE